MNQSTINDQISEAPAAGALLSAGQAPAIAFAMLDLAMAETLATAMRNAASRQQLSSMSAAAATTMTCARLLGARLADGAMPPAPPPVGEPQSETGHG